jgi:TatD-related deoxyribonuclease
LADYRSQFETTEQLGRRIREETGVIVYNVVAPYPVDLIGAAETLGLEGALGLHRDALDLAGRWVTDRRAVALGEVGRAHFPVSPEVAAAIDTAFRHAFEVARDVHCPLIVHSADLDATGFAELSERAREVGLPSEKVVKHFARARLPAADRHAIVPSYLARRELVARVRADPGPWFLETDFLDDPARPGVVLDLATVPRRAVAIANDPAVGADSLYVPFVESIEKVYGWRPEPPAEDRP